MINKSKSTVLNEANIPSLSSANAQRMMNDLVAVSNVSDTAISALPPEMIHHIGTFLNLKDKVSFSQALIDGGFCVSLDQEKILQEFNSQFLTQKIDILLGNKKKNYDFSQFYTAKAQSKEEIEDIYSLLFDQMCDSFKSEKVLSEKIAALVETHDLKTLDVVKIKLYVDGAQPKDVDELVNYLFPNLTDLAIRREIEHRVRLFDVAWNAVFTDGLSFHAKEVAEELLAFLKMEKEHRGMPIELAMRAQKLATSHLLPIIQKASEKIYAMSTEALRALLIMALDELQMEDFCEKMIELGTIDNPFYAKGSPFFHALKSDLFCRASLAKPNCYSSFHTSFNHEVYKYHVVYHADDAYLREHVELLMRIFLDIQIKNGEDPKTETQYGDLGSSSPYQSHIHSFYARIEKKHGVEKSLEKARETRKSLLKSSIPAPDELDANSPEYILDSVARCSISLICVKQFLSENPHHINAQNSNGDTLVHLFIKLGILPMLRTLIKLGADLNIKNTEGFTPLMLAARLEEMFAVNVLLRQQGVNVNQCDDFGNTALHYAVILNKKMAMLRLLRHEAIDRTIVNNDGKTAFDLIELTE